MGGIDGGERAGAGRFCVETAEWQKAMCCPEPGLLREDAMGIDIPRKTQKDRREKL